LTKAMNAEQLLERDLKNVLNYFAKIGVKRDLEKELAEMKKLIKRK